MPYISARRVYNVCNITNSMLEQVSETISINSQTYLMSKELKTRETIFQILYNNSHIISSLIIYRLPHESRLY
jgi:hypothetical protein